MFKRTVLFLIIMQAVIGKTAVADIDWVGLDFKNKPCKDYNIPQIHVGVFDYTNPEQRKNNLPVVEEYHFSKELQMLLPEKSDGKVDIGGFHYTLRAFPNHHKALNAIMYYQLINGSNSKMPALTLPVECYMQRAISFAPNDVVSYMLYATYLKKTKHFQQADDYYKKAIQIAPNEPSVNYSYGLFLIDLKKYPEALEQAKLVYKNNYPKQKLKQKLIASGYWKD